MIVILVISRNNKSCIFHFSLSKLNSFFYKIKQKNLTRDIIVKIWNKDKCFVVIKVFEHQALSLASSALKTEPGSSPSASCDKSHIYERYKLSKQNGNYFPSCITRKYIYFRLVTPPSGSMSKWDIFAIYSIRATLQKTNGNSKLKRSGMYKQHIF